MAKREYVSRQKRLKNLTPEERDVIAKEFIGGLTATEICRQHNISAFIFGRLADELHLKKAKDDFAAAAAAAGRVADAELNNKARSAKAALLEVLFDCVEIWNREKKLPSFRPKSLGEIAGSITKLADVIGRLTDENEQAPEIIEIRVTGVNPNAPLPPPQPALTEGSPDAIDSEVVAAEPAPDVPPEQA